MKLNHTKPGISNLYIVADTHLFRIKEHLKELSLIEPKASLFLN